MHDKSDCILKSKTAKWIYGIIITMLILFLPWSIGEYIKFFAFKQESGNIIAEQKILLKEIKNSVDVIEIQTARIDQKLRDREEASANIYKQLKINAQTP